APVGLAPKARGEGQVAQLDAKAAAKLLERPQLVQLEEAVFPVAGRRPARNHEARALEIAQHPWRPAGLGCRLADVGRHGRNLNTLVSRSTARRCLPSRTRPRAVRRLRAAASRPR